nr:MAG TPA: hypothetical protein [Caudoviricetes sp.]
MTLWRKAAYAVAYRGVISVVASYGSRCRRLQRDHRS